MIVLAAATVTGCATTLHGSFQNLLVATEPAGATATAAGQTITTPGTLRLSRKVKHVVIRIDKPGYEGLDVTVRRELSGVIWANFALVPVGATIASEVSSRRGWSVVVNDPKAAVLGGVLFPLLGMLWDVDTGAAYSLVPGELRIVLVPLPENVEGR